MPKSILSLSILSAIGASICCIAPAIALASGISAAALLSWLAPLRPYLIGLSIVFLVYAWYQKLHAQAKERCDCEAYSKSSILGSYGLLTFMTILSALLISFPLYARVFLHHRSAASIINAGDASVRQIVFVVRGMGCAECEPEIESKVGKLAGIQYVKASCLKKNTVVFYDIRKTSVQAIRQAINATGYTVQHIQQ